MKQQTRKGFTLVELLVVIAIIALLVSILMPALGRAREMAKRVQCASQQRGIGQAIALYQNDFRDSNPVIGNMAAGNSRFGSDKYQAAGIPGVGYWMGDNDVNFDMNTKAARVGGCLYLLVKYEDIVPKMFLCPSADDAEEMDLQDAISLDTLDIIESWEDIHDFASLVNLSYSYNDPFKRLLDASSSSALILMADQSPKFDTETGAPDSTVGDAPDPLAAYAQDWSPDWTDDDGDNPDHGNSNNHATEVQNVLFADMHVKKHAAPTVGVAEDNIYTYWDPGTAAADKVIGSWIPATDAQSLAAQPGSVAEQDTYLGN